MLFSWFHLILLCLLFFVHFTLWLFGQLNQFYLSLCKHEVVSGWKGCVLAGRKGIEEELEVNSTLISLFC